MAFFITSVPQSKAYIVERFGIYNKTLKTGIHFVWPFIDRISRKLSLKEQILDLDPQPVITKDNVTMSVNAVVFYQITDPKLYTYGVEDVGRALSNLALTTLRNTIGELELDETLSSRDTINTKMRATLDEATDPWGIKVTRVELQEILPPKDIRDAMEAQMKAERVKRAMILESEGKKQSKILEAEGKKAAMILDAEAEKEAAILRAQAEKETIVRNGEAEAEAIRMINDANPGEAYIMLKKLEALEKMADGQATKLVIPSELQNVVSLVSAAKAAK
jgi:regulator of protease activity HflC (stomatin/prohibitin superfamily)